MAVNYCISTNELDFITKAYDEHSIDPAYGLTMIVLCYESACAVFGNRPELEGLCLWIDDFAQAADEGLEHIDRYARSVKAGHARPRADTGDSGQPITLAQLKEWMADVVKSLDYCLNQGFSVRGRDVLEEQYRDDQCIESVMARVRDVVRDARDLVLNKRSHTEKLDKPDSVDVASMFGDGPVGSLLPV